MATLYEQCDAIYADSSLTPAEQRAKAANLKCVGLRDAVLAFGALPQNWSFSKSGVAWSVTLIRIAVVRPTGQSIGGQPSFVYDDVAGSCLALQATVTKNGVAVRWKSPPFPVFDTNGVRADCQFVWQNPPVLIGGGGTVNRNGRLCTYDPVTMVRSLLGNDVTVEAR